MIPIDKFTELAHRTASRYSHRTEPARVFYTFTADTLADFHRRVCSEAEARAAVPAGWVLAPIELLQRAEGSLGSFCSDHGWGDADMQTMDDISGLLAAAPQPVAQPSEPFGWVSMGQIRFSPPERDHETYTPVYARSGTQAKPEQAAQPMTEAMVRDGFKACGVDGINARIGFFQGVNFAERHYGITASQKPKD